MQLARAKGVERIITTDVNEYRLNAAGKFRADATIGAEEDVPEELCQLNEGRLADKVIVCTGAKSASKQALECVDRGGTILFFAVPKPGIDLAVPITDFWRDEVTITTSYGAGPGDLKESLDLIKENKVNVQDMVTHRLSLEEAGLGFKLVAKAGESLKVIIKPHD